MHIPSYQIHNVLKVYSKRLCQGEHLEHQNEFGMQSLVNRISPSPKGKRETIIEKVATDIVERITRFGSSEKGTVETAQQNQNEDETPLKPKNRSRGKFVFNTIDKSNKKAPHTLSAEDSGFLIKQLEKLANETIDNSKVPWSGGMI